MGKAQDKEIEKRLFNIQKFSVDTVISGFALEYGHVNDDFIRNLLRVKLDVFILSQMVTKRTLIYYDKPPTFKEWLFRRSRRINVEVDVLDVIVNPPKLKNKKTVRMYKVSTNG